MPFLRNSPTYRSDASTDFHAWWLKRRGLAQGCAFWGILSHCSPFRESKNPKNQFGGVNRCFQAKLAKSKNVHIIKTTASIPTTFCTVIQTTKCPSWVVPHTHYKSDGRHLEKSKNSHISSAVWAISTKYGKLVQFDPLERPDRSKFEISKIQDGGGRHFEKSKNSPIWAAV